MITELADCREDHEVANVLLLHVAGGNAGGKSVVSPPQF